MQLLNLNDVDTAHKLNLCVHLAHRRFLRARGPVIVGQGSFRCVFSFKVYYAIGGIKRRAAEDDGASSLPTGS